MRVYEASTLISAEFGGIRDLSRNLSLNFCHAKSADFFQHMRELDCPGNDGNERREQRQ